MRSSGKMKTPVRNLAKDPGRVADREKLSRNGVVRESRQDADDAFSEERIMEIIEDAKRNPMTPEEAEAEFRELARYGAAQAKKLGIQERDIPDIIHRFRARNRAS
jgi:hypothetical protein